MSSKATFVINGTRCEVEVLALERSTAQFRFRDRLFEVTFEQSVPGGRSPISPDRIMPPGNRAPSPISGAVVVSAPIPGIVGEVLVKEGAAVKAGDVLLRVEAMKMQNNIFAPADGIVEQVLVEPGQELSHGQGLVVLRA